jgi:hypothetical protein
MHEREAVSSDDPREQGGDEAQRTDKGKRHVAVKWK